MKELSLSQGKVALVDDDTYEQVSQYFWHVQKRAKRYYAGRYRRKHEGKPGIIMLHHVVMGTPPSGYEVDHKDGEGLNNQRSNLRVVTHRVNAQNQIMHRAGHLVGASLSSDHYRLKPWRSQIVYNGKQYYLGMFGTELEAHRRYLQELERMKT